MVNHTLQISKSATVDKTSDLNHLVLGDNSKISKHVIAFGSESNPLLIGAQTTIGINCILQGFTAQITIGDYNSIAMSCHFLTDSGPNASPLLQRIYPVERGPITIGNHCWIGDSVLILPNVVIGDFTIIGANSIVKSSPPPYSIVAGTPAKVISTITEDQFHEAS